MNKISKKIVALATMAAFVLTLVPAAAFAAPADQTGYTVTKAEATADKYNSTTVNITLSDEDLDAVLADTANNVLVWAEDANDAVVGSYGTVTDATWGGSYNASNTFNGMAVLVPNADDNTFSLEINNVGAVGDYKVYVALNVAPHAQSVADAEKAALVKGGVTFHALGDAVGDASNYGVYEGGVLQAEEDVAVNTDLITTFQINDKNGDATAPALKDVVVWAVNKDNGQVTELASIVDEDGNPVRKTGSTGNNAKSYYLDSVNNGETLTVQFSIAGDYVLYAGVGTSYDAANAAKLGLGRAVTTVRVTDNTEVESMDISAYINGSSTEYEMEFDKDANTYVLDLTDAKANFKFNGIDYVTLSGIALEKDNSPAKNQTINFTANEPNTVVRLNPTSDNTSTDGKFQTVFKMESQKNTVITITEPESGVSYDVLVIAQKTSATDIDCTKTGGYVLATTDEHWTADVNANLSSAVQFKVTDEKGDAVEGLPNSAFKLNVDSQPKNTSTLKTSDLEVVEIGDGLYTLKVNNAKAGSKLLTEGKYEVRVALNGVDSENDNIGVSFTAAEFGKVENVELNIVDADTDVELDDQITLNTKADVSLVYVDGNGVKIAGPTDFSWNATNSALAIQSTDGHQLVMKPNTIEHQGVIGSTVTVQAAVPGYGLVTKELTIVSSYNTYSLELDPAEGPVNEYNKVDLSVLNSDGDVAKNINGDIKVVVADSSNEDAKVSVKQAKAVKNGEGALTVYASQETELELVVTVEKDGKIVAADTLNYTVGAADPLAGRTVVMTVDSTEYVVNNNIITGDAAPYIDSAWRTMVPIRALAEAFDAEVYWNQDDETVTINFDAGTKIVMTVDETTYTVNGEEATMDTEPVNTGSRVYVPIRFAAEAMGFHVTPLYNDAGLTASVVFQR